MSDLYRIDYSQDASDGAWVKAHTESLVHLGVLVKVEPVQTGIFCSRSEGFQDNWHCPSHTDCQPRRAVVVEVDDG